MPTVKPILLANQVVGYLVVCEETGEAALVDPGEATPALAAVAEAKCRLKAIWSTASRLHLAGGVAGVRSAFPEAALVCHARSSLARHAGPLDVVVHDHMPTGGWNGAAPLYAPRRPPIDWTEVVNEPLELRLGRATIRVIIVKGVTRDGLAFHVDDALFTGEILSSAGTNRPFEHSASTLRESLERLRELPASTRIHPARDWAVDDLAFAALVEPGNPKIATRLAEARTRTARGGVDCGHTLAEALETNPFLRVSSPTLRAHVLGPAGADASDEEVFCTLLRMRERARGVPPVANDVPLDDARTPVAGWDRCPPADRYEYHLHWRRSFRSWLELPWLERRRAVFDPNFWGAIGPEQRQNFLQSADWQEIRHVRVGGGRYRYPAAGEWWQGVPDARAAREETLAALRDLDDAARRLGCARRDLEWMITTRGFPAWVVDGRWLVNDADVAAYVRDFGGVESVLHDMRAQRTAYDVARRDSQAHRSSLDMEAARSGSLLDSPLD